MILSAQISRQLNKVPKVVAAVTLVLVSSQLLLLSAMFGEPFNEYLNLVLSHPPLDALYSTSGMSLLLVFVAIGTYGLYLKVESIRVIRQLAKG